MGCFYNGNRQEDQTALFCSVETRLKLGIRQHRVAHNMNFVKGKDIGNSCLFPRKYYQFFVTSVETAHFWGH